MDMIWMWHNLIWFSIFFTPHPPSSQQRDIWFSTTEKREFGHLRGGISKALLFSRLPVFQNTSWTLDVETIVSAAGSVTRLLFLDNV